MGWVGPKLYRDVVRSMPIPCVDLIVCAPHGRYLLVRRTNEPLRGEWYLVGGRIHLGESALAAARRKLLEETGIAVEDEELAFAGYSEDVYDRNPFDEELPYHTVTFAFEVRLSEEPSPVLDAQASDWRWAPRLPDRFRLVRAPAAARAES